MVLSAPQRAKRSLDFFCFFPYHMSLQKYSEKLSPKESKRFSDPKKDRSKRITRTSVLFGGAIWAIAAERLLKKHEEDLRWAVRKIALLDENLSRRTRGTRSYNSVQRELSKWLQEREKQTQYISQYSSERQDSFGKYQQSLNDRGALIAQQRNATSFIAKYEAELRQWKAELARVQRDIANHSGAKDVVVSRVFADARGVVPRVASSPRTGMGSTVNGGSFGELWGEYRISKEMIDAEKRVNTIINEILPKIENMTSVFNKEYIDRKTSIILYDAKDKGREPGEKGWGKLIDGKMMQSHVQHNFDYYLDMSSINIIKKNNQGIIKLVSDLNAIIQSRRIILKNLYILDHGSPGAQTFGNGFSILEINGLFMTYKNGEPISTSETVKNIRKITNLISQEGTLHLRGCDVADKAEGKQFIEKLSNFINRKVTAYTGAVLPRDSGLFQFPSSEICLARPNNGVVCSNDYQY